MRRLLDVRRAAAIDGGSHLEDRRAREADGGHVGATFRCPPRHDVLVGGRVMKQFGVRAIGERHDLSRIAGAA